MGRSFDKKAPEGDNVSNENDANISQDPLPSGSATTPVEINETTSELAAVSVKLPDFWPHLPLAWFKRIEAQFALRNVTAETTKYEHLMTKVDESIAMKVMSVIEEPGPNPYTTLKNAIIKAYTLSEEQKMKELLRDADLGDRKPSEFFNFMKSVAGGTQMYSDEFLLALWEERLPNQVTAILKIGKYQTTSEKTAAADSIFDALQNTSSIHSVSSNANAVASTSYSGTLQELQIRNQNLEKEIEALKFTLNRQNKFSRRSRSKSSGGYQNNQNQNKNSICYYHQRFKEKAHKCEPPCNFNLKFQPKK